MDKLIFTFLFITSFHLYVFAQEDIKAKHGAYYLCINSMEKEPQQAFARCSEYLKTYPDDDKRLTDFVKGWISAYEKISRYIDSTNNFLVSDAAQTWSIYKPDLSKKIPIIKEIDRPHKIEIFREYNSPFEEDLLSKAEAVYENPKDVQKDLLAGWRYLSNPNTALPDGEAKWWSGSSDSILSTDVVTTGAVLYYYNISRKMQADNKQKIGGFVFQRSELKYQSSIKKLAKYDRGGKSFSNVYVADMNLTWGQVCGGLCGEGFTRNKIVVLSEKGEVLEMFLDNPVNQTSWVS